ncbi:MAG: hypothetical protein DRI23_05735 [Candidatus Cloacimonadota bacterium]|nr:MAG: hypothetical protein DRI23_05735 [Candidatus Cloacimonadota bacterium]
MTLLDDLKNEKKTLDDFRTLSLRVLGHLKNVISLELEYKGYNLYSAESAGQTRNVRPINRILFIDSPAEFEKKFIEYLKVLPVISSDNKELTKDKYHLIDSVTYTMQQAVGIGFDLLGESNSARKHVGNRFEDLIRIILTELGITNRKMILKIPYSKNEVYRCETDVVITPINQNFDANTIAENELVVSLKTTSKDRMSKIFIDKLLMKKFLKHDVKMIAIFLNDVQRKNPDKISYTLVSNLFLVYTKFLARLQGVYFVDLPPKALERPFNKLIFPFSKFIIEDIWKLNNP